MRKKMDPSQYANQKGLSIQHYLVKMLDKVLETLDKNSKRESLAVLATMVDWKQAFPRQCPKLINNGVRPSLIPLLTNSFQQRKMKVKWHGVESSIRDLKMVVDLRGPPLAFGNTCPNPIITLTVWMKVSALSLWTI